MNLASVQQASDAAPLTWPAVVVVLASSAVLSALVFLPEIRAAWTRARHVLDNLPAVIDLQDYRSNVVKLPAPRVGGQR